MSAPSGSEPSVGSTARPFLDASVPPLPENATAEQKDQHWFQHVYQGDRMPQLTVRAVIMGGLLGMLTSVANLYTTLKIGWAFGVAITACVLSYVIWNGLRALSFGRLSQMSILENNCMASTASAAGYSTGSTIATCFGALLIINREHVDWKIVAIFTFLTGAMGVFLAIPMKRQMINHEQLPFPSGIAAASTLKSLYSEGAEAVRRAYVLIAGIGVGALVGILNTGKGTLGILDRTFDWMATNAFPIQLPAELPAGGFWKWRGKELAGSAVEPSVVLIGAGLIVGLPVSLSMLASAAAIYYGVTPWLAAIDADNINTPGWVISIPGGEGFLMPTRWGLWTGTSIMVFASLSALALQWKTIVRSFSFARSGQSASSDADLLRRMAAIEVPTAWLIAGMVPITIAMVVLQYVAFSIAWWAGLLAVALSFVLSLVASRATGETDTTPIGAMGKVMQFVFAVVMPGKITPNLISAGIAANSASSSADLLTDLKAGYMLGANPRKQFIAQFIGIFFGTAAIVPAWYLMVPTVEAIEKYPLPATNMWVAVAKLLSEGIHTLPVSARWGAVVGAIIGIALPIIQMKTPARFRGYLPSAMGLGLGAVIPLGNAVAFVLGATIAKAWRFLSARNAESYTIPVASGLIAGESLIKAVIAMTATAIGLFKGSSTG